jgi:hypothetical protein
VVGIAMLGSHPQAVRGAALILGSRAAVLCVPAATRRHTLRLRPDEHLERHRSVPQIQANSTRTMASVGSIRRESGTRSTRTSIGPWVVIERNLNPSCYVMLISTKPHASPGHGKEFL